MSSDIVSTLGNAIYDYLGIKIVNNDEDILNGMGMFKDIADISIEISITLAQNPEVFYDIKQQIDEYKKEEDK